MLSSLMTNEILWLFGIFFAVVIATSIVFPEEDLITNLKLVAGLFWMFLIPGFMVLYRWESVLSMLERVVIAVPTSVGIYGLLSYLLGILGLPVWNQVFLLPAIVCIAGIAFWWYMPHIPIKADEEGIQR